MKNKKLHLTNELLNEFDTARSQSHSEDALMMLDGLQERIGMIRASLTKDDVFYSILEFIWNEVYCIKEDLLISLNGKKSSEVAKNG